jgi:hypothetical protein
MTMIVTTTDNVRSVKQSVRLARLKRGMEMVQFALYYARLRSGVLLGLHETYRPLGLKWRWRIWRMKYQGILRKKNEEKRIHN